MAPPGGRDRSQTSDRLQGPTRTSSAISQPGAGRGTGLEHPIGSRAVDVIRVVLAEDNALLREGVSRLIETHDDLELVGVASDLPELLAVIGEQKPDVVVTDIRMPPTGSDEGIQAASWLRQHDPKVGVVVLSQYTAPSYALTLLQDGSAGRAYLLKERVAGANELAQAIRAVASGGSVIDPLVVDELVRARASRHKSDLEWLTPRESEILAEMAQGKSNGAHRGNSRGLGAGSRKALERHLLQAWALRGKGRQSTREGCARLLERPIGKLATPGLGWHLQGFPAAAGGEWIADGCPPLRHCCR